MPRSANFRVLTIPANGIAELVYSVPAQTKARINKATWTQAAWDDTPTSFVIWISPQGYPLYDYFKIVDRQHIYGIGQGTIVDIMGHTMNPGDELYIALFGVGFGTNFNFSMTLFQD